MKTLLLSLLFTVLFLYGSAQETTKITTQVEYYQGWYIFWPGQTPTIEYEYLGTFEPKVIKNFKASTLLDSFTDKARDRYTTGNAIIFTERDLVKADVVRLKIE